MHDTTKETLGSLLKGISRTPLAKIDPNDHSFKETQRNLPAIPTDPNTTPPMLYGG